jgi:hypothetical protein
MASNQQIQELATEIDDTCCRCIFGGRTNNLTDLALSPLRCSKQSTSADEQRGILLSRRSFKNCLSI